MPLRTFLSDYSLTGAVFWIGEILWMWWLFPAKLGLWWTRAVGWFAANYSPLPPPLQAITTTAVIAGAVLSILLAGFFLDLLIGGPLSLHEGAVLASEIRKNDWFSSFMKSHASYLSPADLKRLESRPAAWRSFLSVIFSPVLWFTRKKWRETKSWTELRVESAADMRIASSFDRLHALLISNVAILPANTKLEVFADEFYFWRSSRILAVFFLLVAMQTVVCLGWACLATGYLEAGTDGPAPPVFAQFLRVFFGFVIIALVAYWFVVRAYSALVRSTLALNYCIFFKDSSEHRSG